MDYLEAYLLEELSPIPDLNEPIVTSAIVINRQDFIIRIPKHIVEAIVEKKSQGLLSLSQRPQPVIPKLDYTIHFVNQAGVKKTRLYHCNHKGCSFRSTSQGGLTRHKRGHLNPYVCTTCKGQFTTMQEFVKHRH